MAAGNPLEKRIYVGNLPENTPPNDLRTWLGLHSSSCALTINSSANGTGHFADVRVPSLDTARSVLAKNGLPYMDQHLVIQEVVDVEEEVVAAPAQSLAEVVSGGVGPAVGDDGGVTLKTYISIDTTRCNDCYSVPTHAAVVYALSIQFPKAQDPDRVVIRQWGKAEGLWRVETKNIDMYGAQFLVLDGKQIGFIEKKSESFRKDASGNVTRERVQRSQGADRDDDDLLVTLFQANTDRFASVSNASILEKIVALGFELKKAPQGQKYKGTDEYNGNKFFVIKGVTEEKAKTIPSHFTFLDDVRGSQRMWLNHRLRKRYCSFCGTEHETECPTRALYAQLRAEKTRLREANGNLDVHVMSDSTLRYAEQDVLATDVHAMSGATTGNILNAVEVSLHKEVPNLIVVAGQNELRSDLSEEEFVLLLKEKEVRLRALAASKKIAILKPPPQGRIDAVEQAKESFFHGHLAVLGEEIENIKVWDNPIDTFEEDGGRHPNPEQTAEILLYLDAKAKEDMGVSIFLGSGPNDLISQKKKYRGVKSLYKYGCGACADKSRNKWWSLCTNCSTAAKDPDTAGTRSGLRYLHSKASEIRETENPLLGAGATETPGYRERSPLRDGGGSVEECGTGELSKNKRFKFCYDNV